MTVIELVEQLQMLDPDLIVCAYGYSESQVHEAQMIQYGRKVIIE
jgi:hypothetical protein